MAKRRIAKATKQRRGGSSGRGAPAPGPLTLEQAQAMARAQTPRRAPRRALVASASPGSVGIERKRLALKNREEIDRRVREYKATLSILKKHGVKGLEAKKAGRAPRGAAGAAGTAPRRRAPSAASNKVPPLQIFAEGDSWFDYPALFFGGGIVPRLEKLLGVPVLNLAKAGDEVRFMLGVVERKLLIKHLKQGCPAGGPWDALLFSGGGNDIVDNPMALWIRDFDAALPIPDHIHAVRFDAALALVRAGYEDLIEMRDRLSPTTHLILHAYDFAIPDGRGICHLGPWLRPTFTLRNFPAGQQSFEVVKAMLQKFAATLQTLADSHPRVSFLNTQGTLVPKTTSWHNELHPTKGGFNTFAGLFHKLLRQLFPGRVL